MGRGVVGIDHVQLAMPAGPEAEVAAVAFYGGVLGLAREERPADMAGRGGAWFRSPAGIAVHLGVEDPFTPARKAHPAFVVDGFDEVCAAVRAAGGEVRDAPEIPGVRRAHVFDPFGNRIELIDGSTR